MPSRLMMGFKNWIPLKYDCLSPGRYYYLCIDLVAHVCHSSNEKSVPVQKGASFLYIKSLVSFVSATKKDQVHTIISSVSVCVCLEKVPL